MKISKSKQELARIISENGGWRDGYGFSAQDGNDCAVWFYDNAPVRSSGARWVTSGSGLGHCGIKDVAKLPNWHQTILSRAEYFHLYPAPDANPQFCESVMQSIPGLGINSKNININITQVDDIDAVESKPTIEQLAAEYQSKLAIATQAQDEADSHRCGAEVALSKLEVAVKELGFKIEPITAKQESELVITYWSDLQIGDVIEYVDGDIKSKNGMTGPVVEFEPNAEDGMNVRMKCDNGPNKGRLGWPRKWRFIRRP